MEPKVYLVQTSHFIAAVRLGDDPWENKSDILIPTA